MATNLTMANFDAETANGTVLVDFWAEWCAPCRMLSPVVEELAQLHPDVNVCKVNVDDEQELAARFDVMSIPTVLIFKDGKVTEKSVGLVPLEALERLL